MGENMFKRIKEIFKKKTKQVPLSLVDDYKEWDKDFSFLDYVLTKKKELYIKTRLETENSKIVLNSDSPNIIVEDLIKKTTSEIVAETLEIISKDYFTAISTKYFSSDEKMISYITEIIYFDLALYAKNMNAEAYKLRKAFSNQKNEAIQKFKEKEEN